jgi:uncharacterized protein YjbJ (UPF0337 family)
MTGENKDLGTQDAEDTAKGKLKEGTGKVQKNVGKALGNEEMKVKDKVREMSGKAESKADDVKRKADNASSSEAPERGRNQLARRRLCEDTAAGTIYFCCFCV